MYTKFETFLESMGDPTEEMVKKITREIYDEFTNSEYGQKCWSQAYEAEDEVVGMGYLISDIQGIYVIYDSDIPEVPEGYTRSVAPISEEMFNKEVGENQMSIRDYPEEEILAGLT